MEKISRREFLKRSLLATGGIMAMRYLSLPALGLDDKPWKWSREAMFYTPTPRGIRCRICPNECNIRPGETSQCRNRVNYNGKLYTIAYGNPCAVHIDPIEKKPLYHYLPGTKSFSIATAGCNFGCLNCQNWEISQSSPKETNNAELFPEQVVEQAIRSGCKSIAYTYSEPITFYEYMYETAGIAQKKGIGNVLVSNGYIKEEPLRELAKRIDAANIDLKSFSNDIYLKLNAGTLEPVLNTLRILREMNVWVEITNLVIPTWSDDYSTIRKMCQWLASNGFSEMPLHFSRFFPLYKLTQLPQTPTSTLIKAREIAQSCGLKHVYIGNAALPGAGDTTCPSCGKVVVERKGYNVSLVKLNNGKCGWCGANINGRWS